MSSGYVRDIMGWDEQGRKCIHGPDCVLCDPEQIEHDLGRFIARVLRDHDKAVVERDHWKREYERVSTQLEDIADQHHRMEVSNE